MATTTAFRKPVLFAAIVLLLLGVAPSPAEAATKYTCSGSVCMRVEHVGSTVTEWRAAVYPGSGYNCRTARFWRNGSLVQQVQVCATGTLYAYASTPYTAPSGTQLCASFVGESGYPCVTL